MLRGDFAKKLYKRLQKLCKITKFIKKPSVETNKDLQLINVSVPGFYGFIHLKV